MMTELELKGKGICGGKANGAALVTKMPMNLTAAHTKPSNLPPWRRAVVMDRHHELYKQNLAGKVVVFPACIGSTYTGMVLLELMYRKTAPAALIVQSADSLLVSGAVLAEVWFQAGVPVIEYSDNDLFEKIKTGDKIEVDAATGIIKVQH